MIMVNYEGEEVSLRELCSRFGVKFHTAYGRRLKGYSQEQWFVKKLPHNTPTGTRHGKYKHGCSNHKSRAYDIYHGMIQRCTNPKVRSYKNYGGRGIRVAEDWLGDSGFVNFLANMGEPPSSQYSIERIDTNGNYCKENCKWIEKRLQSKNRRGNKYISHNGVTMTVTEWSLSLGLSKDTVRRRLSLGLSIEKCLSTIKRKNQFDNRF